MAHPKWAQGSGDAVFGKAQGILCETINKHLDEQKKGFVLPAGVFTDGGYTIDEMLRYLKQSTDMLGDLKEQTLHELIDKSQAGAVAKILQTIWTSAFESNMGRNFVDVIVQDNPTAKIPKEGRPNWNEVSSGEGDGPQTQAKYSFVEWSVKKYKAVISITKDMIQDAQWSVIQRQLNALGMSYGEFETNLILDTMYTDAGQAVTGAGTLTMAKLVEAWRKFQRFPGGGTRNPTHLILSPEHYENLTADSAFQNILYHRPDLSTGNKMQGAVGFIPGNIQVVTHPALAASTSMMIAKDFAGVLLVRQDLNLEEIDDPLNDLSRAKGTSRVAYKTIESTSICKISA